MSKFILNTMKEQNRHMTREKKTSQMLCLVLTALFLTVFPLVSSAQPDTVRTPKVYIAPYKGDAPGAYTLVQDDFGAPHARGLEMYSDTIAFNRGIPFCFATITKECDANDWKKANEMIKHGHQILNHSHSHLCGQPQSWCTFGDWNENDFAVEIDQSTELIQTNTGVHPAFFVFPFDLFTDTMITYLASKGYAGTRAGAQNQLQMYSPLNPLRINYTVYRPDQPYAVFTQFAEQAIAKKGWAVRVMHGVADDSWGALTVEQYREHINYLKQKSDQRQLWVATMSDVLWYMTMKAKYDVKIASLKHHFDKQNRVERISFTEVYTNHVYTADEKANEKTLKSTAHQNTLSIVLVQPYYKGGIIAYQKGKLLTRYYSGEKLIIEANPEDGDVTIEYLH